MVRVLHLLAHQPDFQTERTAAALVRYAGAEYSVTTRTIGKGGDFRSPAFACLALRQKWAAGFDLVHTWDSGSLMAALIAGVRRVVHSPAVVPGRSAFYWLKHAISRRRVDLVCGSTAQRQWCIGNGISPERCLVIRPGVDAAGLGQRRDPALRKSLGFCEADHVLLAPGESTRRAGHRESLWTVSILHVLDPHSRALLWGRGGDAILLERLAGKLHQQKLLTTAPALELEKLTRVADAVLFSPRGPTPILPLAMCMTAGLPIIASASRWSDEVLTDRENAMVAPRCSPRMLAQTILELRANPSMESTIGAGARATAEKLFSTDHFIAQYRDLYQDKPA